MSAGTIGTPLLLQLSGIGLQEDLDYNNITSWLPLPVGRNLQDHPACWTWFTAEDGVESIGQYLTDITDYYSEPKSGYFSGIGTVSLAGFFNTPSNSDIHIECYFYYFDKKSQFLVAILPVFNHLKTIQNTIVEENKNNAILLITPSLLDPKSRGVVRINGANGTEALQNPYILFNYFDNQYDRISLIQSTQILLSIKNTPTWKAANVEFLKLPICQQYQNITSDEYCNCYLEEMGSSTFHLVGTASMGKKPKKLHIAKSVCNPKCQVHNTKHLTVADASL